MRDQALPEAVRDFASLSRWVRCVPRARTPELVPYIRLHMVPEPVLPEGFWSANAHLCYSDKWCQQTEPDTQSAARHNVQRIAASLNHLLPQRHIGDVGCGHSPLNLKKARVDADATRGPHLFCLKPCLVRTNSCAKFYVQCSPRLRTSTHVHPGCSPSRDEEGFLKQGKAENLA